MKIMLLTIALALLSSCNDKYAGEPLVIKNNTNARVYYWFNYWNSDSFPSFHFPDTVLPPQKLDYIGSVAPFSASGDGEEDPNWDLIFSKLSSGKFTIYFFDTFPEDQSGWDSIRINYALHRKDITYTDFIEDGYSISYP